jgi:four helix bundle protein
MNANIQGLDTLEAWKRSVDFATRIYTDVLPLLPPAEKWNLDQQIRRAASSVPANIAEGHGRFYYQENIHFCYIARGSLTETYSHLSLANQLGYLPTDKYDELKICIEEVIRIVNGYISYLKRTKAGADEPGATVVVREGPAAYDISDVEDSTPLKGL